MQLVTAPPTMTASIFENISAYFSGSIGTLAIFVIGIVAFFWIVDMLLDKMRSIIQNRQDPIGIDQTEADRAIEFHKRYKATMAGKDEIHMT